jgi:DNA-binding transcriptional ArsR family regulator
MLRAMRQFSELFEHDYDLVMIFLSVAEAGLQAVFHLAAVNAQEIDIDATYEALGAAGLSILNIGESTSIPRETVRRKVKRLVDMGYLSVRDKDKSIYLPASAISNPKVLEIFSYHVKDVGALVKTISFYSRDHHEA